MFQNVSVDPLFNHNVSTMIYTTPSQVSFALSPPLLPHGCRRVMCVPLDVFVPCMNKLEACTTCRWAALRRGEGLIMGLDLSYPLLHETHIV